MITVADLKDYKQEGPDPILYCRRCHSEYSANRADYFACKPTLRLICCGHPLRLVIKKITYEEI